MNRPSDYTLKEIEQIRNDWLKVGSEQFDRIARIAREMGVKTIACNREFYVLSAGNVTVRYHETEGPYDVPNRCYHIERTISASVGKIAESNLRRAALKEREIEVARLDGSNFDNRSAGFQPDDLFYRPGEWAENVLSFEPDAIERERARVLAVENERRDEIFRQLNLDREV